MRRSEAARYARWSAGVALLLACITASVYVRRDVQRHVERKSAPPPPPVDVEKQSSSLTFSKMDGPRKIFTVEASKSTDFKDQDASLLENVSVTIFGKNGDRHDTIHTRSCQYGKEKGAILCTGSVQIDLQSATDAARAANDPHYMPQVVHVTTQRMTFDRDTGDAQTDQPVAFSFPNGTGDGVGAKYNSQEGTLLLYQNVHLNLSPPAPKTPGQKAPPASPSQPNPDRIVHVKGTSLDFTRDARIVHISGPAQADSSSAHLDAGELTLELDENFRSRRLIALPDAGGTQPQLTSQGQSDQMVVFGDQLTAEFAPEGWITRMDGTGSVHGTRNAKEQDDEFHSDSASLDMWPTVNRVKELNLNGGVLVKTRMTKTGDARVLHTGALRMEFSQGEKDQRGEPTMAETLTAGNMEWTDVPAHPGDPPTRTKLQADKLKLAFNQDGKPKQLDAIANVQTERAIAGAPLQTATAKTGVAQLLANGGWSQMELQDDVRLKQGDRNARSDHATFDHAAQTALLTGHAVARDASTETHAPRLLFHTDSGDFRAEGGVRSTDFSPNGNNPNPNQPAQVPANITSDNMEGNSKTGRALYTGHARLWQGDSVLEADSIELLRQTKILNAVGNVRGVFRQAPAPAQNSSNSPNSSSSASANSAKQPSPVSGSTSTAAAQTQTTKPPAASHPNPNPSSQPDTGKVVLWHVSSDTLTYNDITSMAHLEKNVFVQSPDQRIRAPHMDVYFTRSTQAPAHPADGVSPNVSASTASSTNSSPASSLGAEQISRAIGTGGVIVDEGDRRATAERGEYTASDGKFIMTGGDPTLYDSTEGTTKGRQLTFFLADDTIIVDSENGSRTLTKHRVNN
jgi:lipopolysaccharide export system protein LptA